MPVGIKYSVVLSDEMQLQVVLVLMKLGQHELARQISRLEKQSITLFVPLKPEPPETNVVLKARAATWR